MELAKLLIARAYSAKNGIMLEVSAEVSTTNFDLSLQKEADGRITLGQIHTPSAACFGGALVVPREGFYVFEGVFRDFVVLVDVSGETRLPIQMPPNDD